MTTKIDGGKPFTGKHMLAILLLFFGTIITVNFTMAYYATSTWSGLVVKNSYVASQEFNGKVEDVKAQEALGWTGTLTSAADRIDWVLSDKSGQAVQATSVQVYLRRTVTDREDVTVNMEPGPNGTWSARHKLNHGNWIAVIDAQSKEAGTWRETVRFAVKDGAIQ